MLSRGASEGSASTIMEVEAGAAASAAAHSTPSVVCVECEDTEAAVRCIQCDDVYCELCFKWVHNRGNRAAHVNQPLAGVADKRQAAAASHASSSSRPSSSAVAPPQAQQQPIASISENVARVAAKEMEDELGDANAVKLRDMVMRDLEVIPLADRCKYIPLRLTADERQLLALLQGALEVSQYTDHVDVLESDYGSRYGGWGWGWSWSRPYDQHERQGPTRGELIKRELNEVFHLLMGLRLCTDYHRGARLIGQSEDDERCEYLSRVFEVGRRYKLMNPEKMRTTYGKMMFILQDAAKPGRLGFNIIAPIRTVFTLLEEKNALHLVKDPDAVKLMLAATREVVPEPGSKIDTQSDAAAKSAAVKEIVRRYRSDQLSEDDIVTCINSIADNSVFVAMERAPVERALHNLTTMFQPGGAVNGGPSLQIHYGYGGSKLSHDHTTQFTFVLQSLMLWREVITNMFKLWFKTEADLLDANAPYVLRDTGQGLNRVQSAPHVGNAMHAILGKVQQQVRSWVGLSVVHLGDRDVPNALVFIDKYTQVSRIVGPITQCVDRLSMLELSDENIKAFFDSIGGTRDLKLSILADYFKHGFDGSGSDGGSCIDGRLTSSWNWCSKLEKKPFFPLFLLTGFKGFDGSF